MEQRASGVVKKDAVRSAGPVRLNGGSAAAPAAPAASAKILEQRDDAALIEVTCACGRKITIQCDLAGAAG